METRASSANGLQLISILSLLPELPRIKIVDVGAIPSEGPEPFEKLVNAVPCEVVGFEPAANECEKLNRLKKPGHIYMPYVIGDGSVHTFYECESSYMSSLYEPNMALLEKFHNLAPYFQVVRSHDVETRRLDDVSETAGVDFLKVDVQGGELLVFEGATERLRTTLAIHTEVEFLPMYKAQPLFADVDAFLRSRGFALHRLTANAAAFRPLVLDNDINAASSQPLWADAVYVRDFMDFEKLAAESLSKLAVILHENYHSFDLAALALGSYDRQTGKHLQVDYMQRLMTA